MLCAGYGTRLGGLTKATPKPMLPIHKLPLLEYIIHNLALHGFDQIAINLHFLPDLIQKYFGDGSRWNVSLTYSYEAELLGTAGGVKKMENFLGEGEAFLVHYGDIITNQNFSDMLRYHIRKKALATLLLHQRQRSNSVVALDKDNRIIGFLERPDEQERKSIASPWVNSGISICSPEFLDHIPAGVACDLPRDIFSKILDRERLFGYPLAGYRCAIDSPKRLAEAEAALRLENFNHRRLE